MNILTAPNPILLEKASVIEDISPYKGLLQNMLNYVVTTPNCAGLAMPQVGISKRAFVAKLDYELVEIVINPEIMKRSWLKGTLETGEGCLSIPDVTVKVPRHRFVIVKYTTLNGDIVIRKLKGIFAFIFQHEYDHLDGILISSYEQA